MSPCCTPNTLLQNASFRRVVIAKLRAACRLFFSAFVRVLPLNRSAYTLAFFSVQLSAALAKASDAGLRISEATSLSVPLSSLSDKSSSASLYNNSPFGPAHNAAEQPPRLVSFSSMSITNTPPDAVNGEQQTARSSLIASIKEYFDLVGLPATERLTEHAANHHHEDVPAEIVKEDEAVLSAAEAVETLIQKPIPVGPKSASDRLRPLFPPVNYGTVVKGSIFRSSYPEPRNYDFLRSLKLKSIITLVPEPISSEYRDFMESAGIQHFQVHINANKGEVRIQSCDMNRALNIVLDRSNHPILIHCNKGKHRTGCVVGTFKRILGMDIEDIRNDYHNYADPKARFFDEVFIENFDLNTVMWNARKEKWIPAEPGLEITPLSPPPSPISSLFVRKPQA